MEPLDPTDPPLEPGAVVAGYRIERLLGVGGMGAVYAAVHPVIGKRAAVKVIQAHAAQSKSGIERFIQEARLVNQIRHPAIVDVFGFDALPDGRPVLLMELLEGETLGQLLARRGRVEAGEGVQLMQPVLDALAAAHDAGVIHRDLKPENLFVVRGHDGRLGVRVLDFGIAKLVGTPKGSGLTSLTGGQLGTPKYMSPEQCRGQEIDGRSDLYAIGLILFEMLAGRSPYPGGSPAEFLGQHLYAEPARLGAYVLLDPRLEDLVMRLLRKDPNERPASARGVEQALRAIDLGSSHTLALPVASAGDGRARVDTGPSRSLPLPAGGPVVITVSSGAAAPAPTPGPSGLSGPVAGQGSVPPPSLNASSTTNHVEENRVCTIVFADVVGFTALSERFAPEEVKEIIDGCFETMTEVVEKHGGVVDKYIGDCVMAVFGVPRSTDNDAERAVQAALRLQQAVAKYGLRRRGRIKLSLRIGINTGRVFAGRVGGGARRDFTVMGDAVNVASRLQAAAPETSIVIGRDTYRHVTGVFQVEELPSVVAKGKTEPLPCYRVLGPARRGVEEPPPEFYGAATRFVGRRADADRLADLVDQVTADRRAHLVLVHGPAGAGKTRLREEVARDLAARHVKAAVFVGRGSHLSRDATFDLAATILRGFFHVHADDPRDVVAQKLRNGIRAFGRRGGLPEDSGSFALPPLSGAPSHATPPSITPLSVDHGLDPAELGDAIDVLAMMLGADARGVLTAAGESVDDLRARMCAAVARLLALFAGQSTVLLLCDGLEAADDASLDLLDYLAVRLADAPVLLVGFARPALFERRPSFAEGRENTSRLGLAPLSRRATEELARDLLKRAPQVTSEFVRQLVDRADGNPFVLKETLRVLVEAGAVERSVDDVWRIDEARLDQLQLPSTVYGIVQARLDRLSPEHRAALQRAAVVGRVFWEGAIEAMRPTGSGPQGHVREQLERLRANDLVRARESSTFPSDREYAFADNVTREVAYESLSLRLREQYHRALASWLAGRGAVVVDGNPALLAFHYDRGNVPREATRHYMRAGDRCAAIGLNVDAIRSYQRACDIADSTRGLGAEAAGEGEENRICEWTDRVKLRLCLGDTQRRVGRLDEAQTAYEEAWADILRKERRRAQQLDTVAVRTFDAAVQLRLGLVEKTRGAFPAALGRYDEALRLLGPTGDPRLLAPLLAAIGFARYRLGDYAEAVASLKRGLRACARIPRREPDFTDAASHLLFSLSIVFYQQKRLVQAERLGRQAARVIDERRFPQLAAIAHNNLGAVQFQRGEIARARELFLKSLELKEKIGDLYDLAVAHNNLAEVELLLGEAREALAHARRAVQLAEGLAAADALPDAVRNYAAALRANGDVVGALAQAERAFLLCCEPAGRAYLGPATDTLAEIAQAARTAELPDENRQTVDATITRVREKAPAALESAGLAQAAGALRTRLG